jgi:hypothetical protein
MRSVDVIGQCPSSRAKRKTFARTEFFSVSPEADKAPNQCGAYMSRWPGVLMARCNSSGANVRCCGEYAVPLTTWPSVTPRVSIGQGGCRLIVWRALGNRRERMTRADSNAFRINSIVPFDRHADDPKDVSGHHAPQNSTSAKAGR